MDMKKIYLFTVILLFCYPGFTQNPFNPVELTGEKAQEVWQGAEHVWVKQENTIPAFVNFRSGSEPTEEAFFIIIKRLFKLPATYTYQLINAEKDELGWEHKRYQVLVNGVPVDNGIFILHLVEGKVKKYNGYLFKNISISTTAAVSEPAALTNALSHIGATTYKWQIAEEEAWLKSENNDPQATYYPKGELEILQIGENESDEFRLVWKFDIYAHEPMSRDYVYVDAQNGQVVNVITRIHHADAVGTAVTAYRGPRTMTADSFNGQFRLYESGRGNGIRTRNMLKGTNYGNAVEFLDADNYWNNVNANKDEYATDAHWGGEMTYDFYLGMGRNSINGSGLLINMFVHYSSNYVNAFWDGSRMTFGDGNSTYKPLTTLDITSHEITHGLTQYTANLVYQNESGALNESFSDIFGAAVEWYADSTRANWLIGEDIGSAFRNMLNPKAYSDPNTYRGTYWYTGTGDNGGVHINSGVQNHWYYILCMGKSGTNDIGQAYNVTGIGRHKANRIAWRNLVNYLTRTSNYADARFYAIQAAVDLYGPCSPEVEATTKAWHAVGVGAAYVNGVQSAFTATPTNGCAAPLTVRFTNTSANATSYNWDFGDGTTSTAVNPTKIYNTPGNYTVKLRSDGGVCGRDSLVRTNYISINSSNPCIVTMPTSGSYQTQTSCTGTVYDNGGPTANYSDVTSSTVTISPTGASQVRIQFTQFRMESGYDYLYVYNGPSINSPLIGSYTGTSLPPTITSSGPSITLKQYSDLYVNDAGFTINWTCLYPTTAPTANFTADVTTTCTGAVKFTDLTTGGVNSWLWNFGDGTTSTEQHPVHNYLTNGTYTVTLKSTNAFGDNTATKTNYININKPAAPTANNVTLCGPGSASLAANVNAPVTWYDSTGNVVSNSNPFNTPQISSTRTYWVEDTLEQPTFKVGPASNAIGAGGNFTNAARTLRFNVMKNCKLVSFLAYAQGGGYRTVQYKDQAGGVIAERTVYFPNGANRIQVDLDLIPGNNYEIGVRDTLNLFRNTAGAVYPYTDANGMVRITGNNGGSTATAYYYYFYDWEVKELDCVSERRPVTVTVNPTVTANITASSNPSCSASNGSATVTAGGGTPGFTYNWSNGQSGATATGLSSGNVSVTVTDSKGCSATAAQTLTQSTAFAVNATATQISCHGLSDGAINVSVTGGTPNYNYNWGGGVTSQNRTSLAPGTYDVTITDAGGCSGTASQTITEPLPLTVVTSKTDASCNQAQGTASVTSSGGTGVHTYLWNNNQTTQTITGLPSGAYSVVVRDANNCTVSASVFVNNTSSLTFNHQSVPTSCYGGADGSVSVHITGGGKAPFSYLWNTGETDTLLTNLSAGTYYLTITDADRCDKRDTIVVTQPDELLANVSVTNPSCPGSRDGLASVQMSGGTPGYSVQWSTGGNNPSTSQLSDGTYQVTVTDSKQCEAITSFQITDPAPISPNPIINHISCYGNQDANITLNPSGGTPGYKYLWNTGATTASVEMLTVGSYTVTITDNNDCTSSATFPVTQPDEIKLSMSGTDATSANDGTATVTVLNPGTSNYYYVWNNDSTTASITGLAPGTYTVTVTDDNGCETTASITLKLTTGLADVIASGFSFQLFPNPASDEVTIALSRWTPGVSIRIRNILGQEILSNLITAQQTRYDLSPLATGVYVVEIREGEATLIKELVITR